VQKIGIPKPTLGSPAQKVQKVEQGHFCSRLPALQPWKCIDKGIPLGNHRPVHKSLLKATRKILRQWIAQALEYHCLFSGHRDYTG